MHDLIIIGGGPAGVAAGVYAASLIFIRSLKPSGFNVSATGELPFSRPASPNRGEPLSRGINTYFI